MRPLLRFVLVTMPAVLFIAPLAHAQDVSALSARIERLERDITFMQRQVYKGGASTDPNSSPVSGANTGNLQVQLSQIQEQMRVLQGQIEQINFKNQQNADALKSLNEDVDFRLQRLEQAAQPSPAATTEPEAITPSEPAQPSKNNQGFDVNANGANPAAPATYQPGAAAATSPKTPASPSEYYNNAFKQLADKNYTDSAVAFEGFIKKYPKDALIPNAYYWLGESYYASRNFTKAAEGFRKGYEAAPKGQKAPDNLLKLSLSLANLKRSDEACIVLKQVSIQYGTSAKTTAAKADAERKRLNCA